MKDNSSQTLRTARFLMFQKEKILKQAMFKFGRDTVERTRDGQSSILTIKRMRNMRRVKKFSDGFQTNHFISDQDYQCKELLQLQETTISYSTDGLRTNLLNNGSSNQFLRPLETRTGRTSA